MTGALSALLAGATGLVGSYCLRALLDEPRYERVIVVTRRDVGELAKSPRVTQLVTEFARLGDVRKRLVADHVFCALGTTIAKAGSQQRFREIDFEYPLKLAQLSRLNGARHFSIVSAIGASSRSPFFYSRIKGDVEDGLERMGWPSLVIVRPSLIAGERTEHRALERLGEKVLRFAPAAWRPVPARDIAATMVRLALSEPPGVQVIESREIAPDSSRPG